MFRPSAHMLCRAGWAELGRSKNSQTSSSSFSLLMEPVRGFLCVYMDCTFSIVRKHTFIFVWHQGRVNLPLSRITEGSNVTLFSRTSYSYPLSLLRFVLPCIRSFFSLTMRDDQIDGLDEPATDEILYLISAENESFPIPKKVALISELVNTMCEGDRDEKNIPVPNVKSAVLTKVIEYMKYHHENPVQDIEKPLKSANMVRVLLLTALFFCVCTCVDAHCSSIDVCIVCFRSVVGSGLPVGRQLCGR